MNKRNVRHYASPGIGLGVVCAALAGLLGLHATSQTSVKQDTATSRSIPVAQAEVLGGLILDYSRKDEDGRYICIGSFSIVPYSAFNTQVLRAFREASLNRRIIAFNREARKLGIEVEATEVSKDYLTERKKQSYSKFMRDLKLTDDQQAIALNTTKIKSCGNIPGVNDYSVQSLAEYENEMADGTKSGASSCGVPAEFTEPMYDSYNRSNDIERQKLENLENRYVMRRACFELLCEIPLEMEHSDGVPIRYVNHPEGVLYLQRDCALFRFGLSALPFQLTKLVSEFAYNGNTGEFYFPAEVAIPRFLKESACPVPFIYVGGIKDSYSKIQVEAGSQEAEIERLTIKLPDTLNQMKLDQTVQQVREIAKVPDNYKAIVGIFRIPQIEQVDRTTCFLWSDYRLLHDMRHFCQDDSILSLVLPGSGEVAGEVSDICCIFVHEKFAHLVESKFENSIGILQGNKLFDDEFKLRDNKFIETLVTKAKEIPLE